MSSVSTSRDNATAVIVGAGPGVGRAVARAFAAQGHPVALIARDGARLAQLAADLRSTGAIVTTAPADAADTADLVRALQDLELSTPVGVLVYNAAGDGGPLIQTQPSALRRASDVNLHSLVASTAALLPQLRDQHGTVIVTGGGLALFPSSAVGVLSVGKAMARAAALVMAEELADAGVAVRTVTIAGAVAAGGPFDPDRIADVYLQLHRREIAGPEVVLTGAATPPS